MTIYDFISWWIFAGIMCGTGFVWACWENAVHNTWKDMLKFYGMVWLVC